MDLLKHLTRLSSVLLVGTILTSCTIHHEEAVPGAYSTPKNTPMMAGAGAAYGGIVGATAHPGAIPVGAAIGGAVGGTIGAITDRPNAVMKKLAKQDGVQVVAAGQSLKLIIFTDKCFEFGTSSITNSCEAILNNTAALLKLTGNVPIHVTGYSDNGFGNDFALRLTQEQADSIVAYLWAHGIPQERFYAKGHGSANPIATNYTTRGSSLNRRVEIIVG